MNSRDLYFCEYSYLQDEYDCLCDRMERVGLYAEWERLKAERDALEARMDSLKEEAAQAGFCLRLGSLRAWLDEGRA